MSSRLLPWLALIGACLLWASAFVFIKPMVAIMPAAHLAALRYGIAAIIIALCYWAYRGKSPANWKVKLQAFLYGFIGIGLYNLVLSQSEVTITAATSAFIVSGIGPCVAVMLSVIFLKEKSNRFTILGMALCLFGLGYMTMHHWGFSAIWGLGYALIAACCGGAFSVLQKPLLKYLKPFEFMTFAIIGGFIFSFAFSQHISTTIHHASHITVLTIVYLAIFPAIIAYSLWAYGIKYIPVTNAVSILYFLPVITALQAWLFHHTMPAWNDWAGGVLILAGAFLMNNRKSWGDKVNAVERLKSSA